MTTPQTPEQLAAECKRLASEFGKAVVRVSHGTTGDNIEALMAAEQALDHSIDSLVVHLRAAPVPMTDEQIAAAVRPLYRGPEAWQMGRIDDIATARAIEAPHGIKP